MKRVVGDLTGQRFGRLTVLSPADPCTSAGGKTVKRWLCQCDCGNQTVVAQNSLTRSGGTKSCGCARKGSHKTGPQKDLTGQRFGCLTVLGMDPASYRSPSGKMVYKWLCLCDCGNEVSVAGGDLMSGRTQSCGCLQRETAARTMTKDDLAGKRFGRLLAIRRAPLEQPKRGGQEKYGWLCRCDCGQELVVPRGELINEHVQSCGCLKIESSSERLAGSVGMVDGTNISFIRSSKPSSANRSGVKGVSWDSSRGGCWRAKIQVRGKNIYLGRYDRLEDAAKARHEAEERYYQPIIEAYDATRPNQAAPEEKKESNQKNKT